MSDIYDKHVPTYSNHKHKILTLDALASWILYKQDTVSEMFQRLVYVKTDMLGQHLDRLQDVHAY